MISLDVPAARLYDTWEGDFTRDDFFETCQRHVSTILGEMILQGYYNPFTSIKPADFIPRSKVE
jgi:hypothetical protein